MAIEKYVRGYTPLEVEFNDNTPISAGYTVVNRLWNFGDGFTSATNLDYGSTIIHTYSGNYTSGAWTVTLGLTAADVTGGLFDLGTISATDYVTPWGLFPRWGTQKDIDLVTYLPDQYKTTDVEKFLQFFEDFLNNLYIESPNRQVGATSADPDTYVMKNRISILEKVHRLTDLHDPSLIDIDYIQFFANYLGYDVNINRAQIPGLNSSINPETTPQAIKDFNQEKYLRFLIENLPNWYKIKTTKNAVKILLFSFGLIADILTLYTTDYKTFLPGAFDTSSPDISGGLYLSMQTMRDEKNGIYYPTSHFVVPIDIDKSSAAVLMETKNVSDVIAAIESIRPINTVFEYLVAWADRKMTAWVKCFTKFDVFIDIPWEGPPADFDLFFIGHSYWDDPLCWSSASNGPPIGRVPNKNTRVHFDEHSPVCTLTANANCYSIDTTGYTSMLDVGNQTLTIEEDCIWQDGAITVNTAGTIIFNNSVSGTVLIGSTTNDNTGIADQPTYIFKKTTNLIINRTIRTFEMGNLQIADPGIICNVTFGPGALDWVVRRAITINGGTIDNFTVNWMAYNNFIFVPGSDITSNGGQSSITCTTNSFAINLPEMLGATMLVNLSFEYNDVTLNGDIKCGSFYHYNGNNTTLTTNGYSITCQTGGFGVWDDTGKLSIDFTKNGGSGTVISANGGLDINNTTHGGTYTSDGEQYICETVSHVKCAFNIAGTVSTLALKSGTFDVYSQYDNANGSAFSVNDMTINPGVHLVGVWAIVETPPYPPIPGPSISHIIVSTLHADGTPSNKILFSGVGPSWGPGYHAAPSVLSHSAGTVSNYTIINTSGGPGPGPSWTII